MSLGPYHDELYQQVLPMHGPDPDGLAQAYVGACVHGVVEVDELVRDTEAGPGWGVILDVDDAPVKGLRWLAQLAGVRLRAPKPVAVRNLINVFRPRDGSFEHLPLLLGDGGSWITSKITLSQVSGGTVGDYQAHAAVTTNGNALISTSTIETVPYARITLAVDVITASRDVRFDIEFYDGTSSLIDTVSGPTFTGTGRMEWTLITPATAESAGYQVVMPGALVGEFFDVDAFAVVVGTDDGAYFDGYSTTRLETDEEWGAYARSAIRNQGQKFRGTRRAMTDAVRDTLLGAAPHVDILERVGGNAYALTLVTRPSETPDPDATYAAALTQKPLGMALTHTLTEGVIIDEGTKTIDTATATIDTATLSDVAD